MPAAGLGPRLTIDLAALARNWRALEKVSAGALCAAVVKADAYGVGITAASEAFYAAGARFFFTATVDEGLAVRRALPDAHIFILDGLYSAVPPMPMSADRLDAPLPTRFRDGRGLAGLSASGATRTRQSALHFDTGM